jgi:hypothetical protein
MQQRLEGGGALQTPGGTLGYALGRLVYPNDPDKQLALAGLGQSVAAVVGGGLMVFSRLTGRRPGQAVLLPGPDAEAVDRAGQQVLEPSRDEPEAGAGARAGAPAGAVDLHNHIMGVNPVDYFVDKVGRGSELALYERTRALFEERPELRSGPEGAHVWRLLEETRAELEALERRGATAREKEAAVREHMTDALAATEKTPFDVAYGPRDALVRNYIGFEEYAKDTMRALADEGIVYSEQSVSLGKLEDSFSEDTMDRVRADLAAEGVATDMRFLAMVQTRALSSDGSEKASETFEDTAGRVSKALERSDVAGVDFAGPEKDEFTAEGMANFRKMYATVSAAARLRGRPLVLRPHVGEGYAERGASADPTAHIETARHNIEMLLETLEDMGYSAERERKDGVIIRLGHATHATPEQIERMSRLGVIVEANIGSNVATGTIERASDHPLLYALYYGTPTVLGTDGEGVMGTTIAGEYKTAADLIHNFKAGNTSLQIEGKQISYADLPPSIQSRFDMRMLVEWSQEYLSIARSGDDDIVQRGQ